MTSGWFAQVKAWPVAQVAARFGLPVLERGPDASFPCPACRKVVRHSKGLNTAALERAPRAAKVVHGGAGWWCEPCGATGDAVALAAALVAGAVKPAKAEDWAEVRRECAALGLCEADSSDPRAPTARRYEPPVVPELRAPEALERLPAVEVAALWGACSRLDAVPGWDEGSWCGAAREFLVGRGLSVATLAAIDAARILPPVERHAWPSWWPSSWVRSWRVAVPLYDGGEIVALQARAIEAAEPKKTRNPMGSGVVRGTFFADAGGLEVLRGTWAGSSVVVVEGLTDFLAAAQLAAGLDAKRRPAVLGIVAGSARSLAGVKLTALCRLVVMTDNDDTGERYFREVKAALPQVDGFRVRLKPLDGKRADLGDWLKHHPAAALAALTHGTEGGAHGG